MRRLPSLCVSGCGIATIAFFSDTHLAAVPVAGVGSPDERLDAAVAAVAAGVTPDLVILPGDIADAGEPAAYDRVARAVAPLGARVLAVSGNHDLADNVAAAFDPADEVIVDGWRIVLIDTSLAGEIHGAVDAGAVERRLGPDDGTPTLVVLHHPPISLSVNPWFVLQGDAALTSLLSSRTDVRVVVSGHLHRPFEVVLGGVTYVGCPSTWYSIDHAGSGFRKDDGVVGALILELDEGGAARTSIVATAGH